MSYPSWLVRTLRAEGLPEDRCFAIADMVAVANVAMANEELVRQWRSHIDAVLRANDELRSQIIAARDIRETRDE